HDSSTRGIAPEQGDEEFPAEDHQDDPERKNVAKPGEARRGPGAVRYEVEWDEGSRQEELIGDWVQEFPQIRDQPARSRKMSVPQIGEGRYQEDRESQHAGSESIHEEKWDDQTGEDDPRNRDEVGQIH